MKIKYFIILSFLIVSSVILTNKVSGQEIASASDVQYPIQELGNCEDKEACRIYCDKPANAEKCLTFAEKNNLMSEEEISIAKKFLESEDDRPGNCKREEDCKEYCDDVSHIDECIAFAEKNNLVPPEELEEIKKVQSAIKRGAKPPPCGNKKQCDTYCEDPSHMEECITFGAEAGFIQGKELEDAQKMLQAIKRGATPLPCKGKEACDEYCSSPDNMELCMNFAMEAGFMSEEEKADSQKMLQAIKKGFKPPPCKSREECDAYCSSEEHFEECTNFSVAAGFMSEEDATMARKTGGKGPGDCKGKEECEAFCNNPDNQETCFNFAKENGMIPEEELRKMEEGKEQFRQSFEQMPSEVLDCIQGEVGADMLEKMKNGSVMPPREIGDKMATCFEKMGPMQGPQNPGGPGEGGMMPPAGQTGPGGCKSEEECRSYCESNPEQCQNFQSPQSPQGQPCEGENCQQYGPPSQMPPCEGENCQNQIQNQMQYRPPEQMQPCEGENCQQYGPPPCEGEKCQGPQQQLQPGSEEFRPQEPQPGMQPQEGQMQPPPGDMMPQNQPQETIQQQPQQEFQPMQPQESTPPPQESTPPPTESATPPPPPPPPSAFFKSDSFLGAVLYPLAKALYNVR